MLYWLNKKSVFSSFYKASTNRIKCEKNPKYVTLQGAVLMSKVTVLKISKTLNYMPKIEPNLVKLKPVHWQIK